MPKGGGIRRITTLLMNMEGSLYWAGRLYKLRTAISALNVMLMFFSFAVFTRIGNAGSKKPLSF
jgi:hypothetical protein